MDDLMARTMVENLSIGIDPLTRWSPTALSSSAGARNVRRKSRSAKSAGPSGIQTPARPGRRKRTDGCAICMSSAGKTNTG